MISAWVREGCRLLLGMVVLPLSLGNLHGQLADTPPIRPEEGGALYRWEDAELAVGRSARIVGKVERVGRAGRVRFLNFHLDRRDVFKVVIFKESDGKFGGPVEDLYAGKFVEVRGKVTRYAGVPQIVVRHPNQIRVLSELPKLPDSAVTQGSVRTQRDFLRVATFNVKNLFDAYDDPYTDDEGTVTKPRDELENLAHTMHVVDADVWALQEVEDRRYLQRFVDVFLSDLGYEEVVLIEGNDDRGIDVGLISRLPIGAVVSHRHQSFPGAHRRPQRFSRDVLRVVVEPPQACPFEVWVVHLKSNADGRETAEPIRRAEAAELQRLYELQTQTHPSVPLLLCGDFNDTEESDSLAPLLKDRHAPRPLFASVPVADRITYNRPPYRSMIDFLFASPAMEALFIPDSYRIHAVEESESGSDHRPVSADFHWAKRVP